MYSFCSHVKFSIKIGLLVLVFTYYGSYGQSSLLLQDAFPKVIPFADPIEIIHASDLTNRLFVAEQAGVVRVFPNDSNVTNDKVQSFIDLRSRITSGGEMGLLGMAFDPAYRSNGYFYVNYTRTEKGQLQTVISRFHVSQNNPNQADAASEKIILVFDQPYANHNGGKIAFGKDGYLYIATGDGGSGGDPQNNGQDLASLLGKILRINVNKTTGNEAYSIPADNPFIKTKNARHEIYAFGLRNPWRFNFDTVTGALWVGDVGQNAREEVDLIIKGGNYGWRYREGKACYNPDGNCPTENLIEPIWDYTQASGAGRSVTGGLVYRGRLLPTLSGKYVYGDYVTGNIWALTYDTITKVATNEFVLKMNGNVAAFGEDENHELYLCNYQSGHIQKLKDLVLASEDNLENRNQLLFFPNPASTQLHVKLKLSQSGRVSLYLYSMQGKLMHSFIENKKVNGEQSFSFDIKSLPTGNYVYQLETEKFSQTGKVHIVR